jgi:hypothetical protein
LLGKKNPNYDYHYDDPTHKYTHGIGHYATDVPSVTTIGDELHAIPFLSAPKIGGGLFEFKMMPKTGDILNASVLDFASERGTKIHTGIEQYVKKRMGQTHDLDNILKGFTKEERGSYDKAIGALEDFEKKGNRIEFLGAELRLGGETAHGRIAGTTDIVARIGGTKPGEGKLHIIDFKSTAELPHTVGEQTAAYAHMLRQTYDLDPDEKIGRAVMWGSTDEKRSGHFITDSQPGAGHIFKSYEDDIANFFKKHEKFVKDGPTQVTKEQVRNSIREKLSWHAKPGNGSMYFGTFQNWDKQTTFTMSDFESKLDDPRKEKEMFQLHKEVADELGLDISAGLTSKKGRGVNLYVNPKQGITKDQAERVRGYQQRASSKLIKESIADVKQEFFFLKNQGIEPIGKAISEATHGFFANTNFYGRMGVGAAVGAVAGAAAGIIGRDDNMLSAYDEPSGIATKVATGAAVGSLAGPFFGTVGAHKLSEYAKNCFKAVPGIKIR